MPSSREGVDLGQAALLFGIHDRRERYRRLPRVAVRLMLRWAGAVMAVPWRVPAGRRLAGASAALGRRDSAPVGVDPDARRPTWCPVYTARQLDDAIAASGHHRRPGTPAAPGVELNGGVLGLLAVRRGGQPVQQAPAGYRWPLSTAVMPPEAVGRIMSRERRPHPGRRARSC